MCCCLYICYWDSTVGIVTKSICWTTKELCFDFWQEQEIIPFSIAPSMALKPTQLSKQWGWVVFPKEHEADHSPSSSSEVKNELSYISFPQYSFLTCTGLIVFLLICVYTG